MTHTTSVTVTGCSTLWDFFCLTLFLITKGKRVARFHVWTWLCDNFTLLKAVVRLGKISCSVNFCVHFAFHMELFFRVCSCKTEELIAGVWRQARRASRQKMELNSFNQNSHCKNWDTQNRKHGKPSLYSFASSCSPKLTGFSMEKKGIWSFWNLTWNTHPCGHG